MSTSITKSGILIADGIGVGENLIINSNAAEFDDEYDSNHHWTNWSNATDRTIEDIDGKRWFHCKSPTSDKYGGFTQNSSIDEVEFNPDTDYTVSATFFSSAECNCRLWVHVQSSEGGGNIFQRFANFTVTPTPARYSFTFNSSHHATYTIDKFRLMVGPSYTTEGIDVYFTDVKFEEGSVLTPWTPSVHDNLYVGSELGFDEESFEDNARIASGYMQAREFYED